MPVTGGFQAPARRPCPTLALARGAGRRKSSGLTFALTVASMLVLAWLLHRFVEKPLTPRLRAALAKAR